MSTLLGSIGNRWKNTQALCALVPFRRVFTGRIPTTENYPMPYVSVMEAGGSRGIRTRTSRYPRATFTFHIWVDDTQVALGEQIEKAITDAYAEGEWEYGQGRVIDVLDEGPGAKTQADRPEYKAWEIVKAMTFCLEQQRTDAGQPGSESSGSAGVSGSGSASGSNNSINS